jgi:hypothetical protein
VIAVLSVWQARRVPPVHLKKGAKVEPAVMAE